MRFRAFAPLLRNPWVAVLLGLAGFFNLIALVVAAGLVSATRTIGGEVDLSRMSRAAAMASSIYGIFIGAALSEAARCSCSWQLPGFRRQSAFEFVSLGAAIALALTTLMTALALVPPEMAVHTAALSLAAFALGGTAVLCPEGSLVLIVAFPLWILMALGVVRPERVLPANPWYVTGVAAVLATVAMRVAFGARTYRWAAVTPGSPWGGRPVWETLPTMPWWPRPKRRANNFDGGSRTRLPYAGLGVVRCAVHAFRASRPSLRVLRAIGPIVFVAIALTFFEWTLPRPVNRVGVYATWWTLPWYAALWLQRDDGPSFEELPWPRRHLVRVSCAVDLFEALWYLTVQGPVMVAVFAWIGPPGATPASAARVVASAAVALPAAQWWLRTHGGWRPRRSGLLPVAIVGWFILGGVFVPVVAFGIPMFLRDPALQIAAYGTLFIVAQALHWRRLRRYFLTGDLVGASD